MKKTITILAVSLLTFTTNFSQSYKTAIGLRGGLSNGLTIKHFMGNSVAIEGILTTRWSGLNVTGLFEINNATKINRLDWYYGVGGHIGFWNGANVEWAGSGSHTVIGVDGIIGIEYTVETIPLNISLDWKPAFNLIGHSGFWGDGGALSIRYVL